ncbi:MAG: MBL fold metallo-hydrolase [Anaerolineales bacterium]|nr:MBL fold metallo-hydrolase [Anaerolineales bacterium]
METTFTVKFWGVRGSYPVPGPATARVGGNTACVEITVGTYTIIIDAGTGIINLGKALAKRGVPVDAVLLFGHMHHDHTQGFPFFSPAFNPTTRLHVFGPQIVGHNLEDVLRSTMRPPTFPITLDTLNADISIRELAQGEVILIGEDGVRVRGFTDVPLKDESEKVKIYSMRSYAHPGDSLFYRIEWQGCSVVYASDTEGYVGGDRRLVNFARDADLLIHDAQYSEDHYLGEAVGLPVTQGYGHSTPQIACEVARLAGVRQLALFHHEPGYNDEQVEKMAADARQHFPNTTAAYEGLEIDLTQPAQPTHSTPPYVPAPRPRDGKSRWIGA